jgi:type I site-specific restriction endonuclease
MMAEWEAAVTKFTELTPHLHYSTSSSRRASHRASHHGKRWRIVVISTVETFYQRFNQQEADGSKFWGPGIFHLVIMDEAQRLRTSGTPISKLRKANGTMGKMDS